jgi:hypothetical protein
MSKMKGYLAMAMAMAMMAGNTSMVERETPKGKRKIQKGDVIPKGLKEYYFSIDGSFLNERTPDCVFSCYAINSKNAIRKFNKRK